MYIDEDSYLLIIWSLYLPSVVQFAHAPISPVSCSLVTGTEKWDFNALLNLFWGRLSEQAFMALFNLSMRQLVFASSVHKFSNGFSVTPSGWYPASFNKSFTSTSSGAVYNLDTVSSSTLCHATWRRFPIFTSTMHLHSKLNLPRMARWSHTLWISSSRTVQLSIRGNILFVTAQWSIYVFPLLQIYI